MPEKNRTGLIFILGGLFEYLKDSIHIVLYLKIEWDNILLILYYYWNGKHTVPEKNISHIRNHNAR